MMTSTLVANGAKVYIIGPNQKELDRYCASRRLWTGMILIIWRIAEVYNTDVTEGMGSIQGIQGDVRQKVHIYLYST